MIRTIVCGAVGLAALSIFTPPALAVELTGLYNSTEGQVSLWRDPQTRRWVGEYGEDGGRIDALQTDVDSIQGYWMENSSNVRCETERGGTYYWGTLSFVWSTAMPYPPGSFVGYWSYCETYEPQQKWVGLRLEANG